MSDKVLVFTQVKLETATLQASLLPCFVALLTPYRFKKLCYKKYNIQRHFTDQDLNSLRMSGGMDGCGIILQRGVYECECECELEVRG